MIALLLAAMNTTGPVEFKADSMTMEPRERRTLLHGSVRLQRGDLLLTGTPSLVDKRHRRLWPVVRERQALVGQLQSILRDLGLDRRQQPVADLGTLPRTSPACRQD